MIEINLLTPGDSTLLQQDIYLQLGLAIFPLVAGGKEPSTVRGFYDAISIDLDPEETKERSRRWIRPEDGECNVGIATGTVVDVLDVDVKHGKPGLRSLRTLEDAGLLIGCVAIAETPSGGLHYYFPAAEGARSGAIDALGLDYQAAGKYVVAPPSTLLKIVTTDSRAVLNTASYRWRWSRSLDQGSPFDWSAAKHALGLVDMPSFRSRVSEDADMPSVVETMTRWVSAQLTDRNRSLHWAACRVWEAGATTIEELEPLVQASLALTYGDESASAREVECRRTVASAGRAFQ